MRIYIIDDSKVIRDRLAAVFQEKIKSAKIQTAEDIAQVKADLMEFSPDVVIVDIHLREGTGFDVLELINGLGIKPLRLILTNYALPPYKKKALELGSDYFFDKSHDFNEAIEVIEKYALQR